MDDFRFARLGIDEPPVSGRRTNGEVIAIKALKEILWLHSQHADSAVGRRNKDFRAAAKTARVALQQMGELPSGGD